MFGWVPVGVQQVLCLETSTESELYSVTVFGMIGAHAIEFEGKKLAGPKVTSYFKLTHFDTKDACK